MTDDRGTASADQPGMHATRDVVPRLHDVGEPSVRRVRVFLLASMIVSFFAVSAVPTPLYAIYSKELHFSPITTTAIFSAYAVALLVALLIFGRVSDYVGRRPVLLAALAVEIASTIVLDIGGGVGVLVVGRVLQGLATGAAVGALGAALLDVDPVRGPLEDAATPGVGTAAGALLSGLLVQYGPAPTHLVYDVLIVVFVLQGVGVALLPNTSERKPGVLAALKPQVAVPPITRAPMLVAAPILIAVGALSGLYGSLGPALVRQLTGSQSPVVGVLPFFAIGAVSSVTAVVLRKRPPRSVMVSGIAAALIAALGTLISIQLASGVGFLASTVAAGIGFGAGFQGAFATVLPLAPPRDRAGLLSVLYVIYYLGFGVPVILAGVLAVHGGGLIVAGRDYSIFLIVLTLAALSALLLTKQRNPADDVLPA